MRGLIFASNSSRNSVSAECTGAYGRRTDEADRRHLVRERHGLDAEPLAGRVREGTGADRLADVEQLVEVARACRGRRRCARGSAPATCRPRGTACTCRTTRGRRSGQRQRGVRDVGGLVHHHHRAGAEHRAGRADELALERQVELVGHEPRRRAAAGHERLELVAVADAAGRTRRRRSGRGTWWCR